MNHISVIVPRGVSVVDNIIAPYNLFKMAITYATNKGQLEKDQITIDLVGQKNTVITYQGLFSIRPTKSIEEIDKTDLIIISPISGNLNKQIESNRGFIDWIKDQRIRHNTDLASLCKGAFLLAETGLINGKSCATHWTVHNEFRSKYPKVNLKPGSIFCEDHGIFSSGGAYSILNFTLYLIERYFGREAAIWCSKVYEIEFDRYNQNAFIVFSGQKEHQDLQIKKAQEYIEMNYAQKLSIDEIAKLVHLNGRSFLRRFKKATSNTPLQYMQRVKVEAAKKKLESTAETTLEVMYGIGYNDEKAFRKTFRKYTGISPKEYRLKYNREMALA